MSSVTSVLRELSSERLLRLTFRGSLLVQFGAFACCIAGLWVSLPKEHKMLHDILTLEAFVQAVEAAALLLEVLPVATR